MNDGQVLKQDNKPSLIKSEPGKSWRTEIIQNNNYTKIHRYINTTPALIIKTRKILCKNKLNFERIANSF